MKKVLTIILMMFVMSVFSQMDDYHILTKEMMKPFQREITQQSVLFSQVVKDVKIINLHLKKTKYINYHFEDGFYYNPITYKIK